MRKNRSEYLLFFTLSVNSEERSRPADAITPPTKVVIWMPNLSVSIPAIGDRKNVIPIVNEPTKATTISFRIN